MTLMLRIILLLGSLIAGGSVIHRIRKSRLQIDDAVFWICFCSALIVIAVFPGIIYILAIISGTQSPANLLYLIIIAVLIMKIFSMSLQISALNGKINKVVQDMALRDGERLESDKVPEAEENHEKNLSK